MRHVRESSQQRLYKKPSLVKQVSGQHDTRAEPTVSSKLCGRATGVLCERALTLCPP